MGPSTPSSAAHRETSPLPSGGLERIRNVLGRHNIRKESQTSDAALKRDLWKKKQWLIYR